jgi:hypothetical protein
LSKKLDQLLMLSLVSMVNSLLIFLYYFSANVSY